MATSSFDKQFIIEDSDSFVKLHQDMSQPRKVKVNRRDHAAENEEGIQSLKRRLSLLQASSIR